MAKPRTNAGAAGVATVRFPKPQSRHINTHLSSMSVRWAAEVWGSCIVDFQDLAVREQILKGSHDMLDSISTLVPAIGETIVFPPFDTPLNFTDYFLATGLYKKWASYFFEHAKTSGPVSIGKLEMGMFNPLAHNSVSMSMTWTYDADVKLQSQEGQLVNAGLSEDDADCVSS
mmetsp:Transcript_4325/g.14630  ORF Transcript_4325/g.14630 Transcript_4325/m.14630 type:complete len:173 (+) Transcript_4325:45-563(+)